MAAENAPGVFRDSSAKQAADFAKVELRGGGNPLLVRLGVDVTKDGDHFLGEGLTVRGGIEPKKASIQGEHRYAPLLAARRLATRVSCFSLLTSVRRVRRPSGERR